MQINFGIRRTRPTPFQILVYEGFILTIKSTPQQHKVSNNLYFKHLLLQV